MGGTRPEAHFLFLETISKAIPKFTTKSDLPGDASAKQLVEAGIEEQVKSAVVNRAAGVNR